MDEEIEILTANAVNSIRKETVDGKEWYVADGVLLVEGVLVANNGPLFYPAPEIKNTASSWDEIPIVFNHPQINGKFVSVHENESILVNSELGYVTNSKWNGKLRTQYRFDMEKADKVDKRIRTKLDAGEPLEISTGLFKGNIEKKEGKFKGKAYKGIAREYTPDHVAILLDSKGACSIDDGCGCLTANSEEANPITVNEMSYNRRMAQISEQIYTKFGYSAYVRDLYSSFFVYTGKDGKLFKSTYTVDQTDGVTISDGTPTEVKWVTEYRTPEGKFVGNCSCELKEIDMDKKKIIDGLIANGVWKETDRAFLDAQTPENLTKFQTPVPATVVTPPPVKKLTLNEMLEQADPDAKEVLEDQIAAGKAVKADLVQQIVANTKGCPEGSLAEGYLNSQPIKVLKVLAVSTKQAPAQTTTVQATVPNYSGAAVIPPLTGNQGVPALPAPMIAPSIDFSK